MGWVQRGRMRALDGSSAGTRNSARRMRALHGGRGLAGADGITRRVMSTVQAPEGRKRVAGGEARLGEREPPGWRITNDAEKGVRPGGAREGDSDLTCPPPLLTPRRPLDGARVSNSPDFPHVGGGFHIPVRPRPAYLPRPPAGAGGYRPCACSYIPPATSCAAVLGPWPGDALLVRRPRLLPAR